MSFLQKISMTISERIQCWLDDINNDLQTSKQLMKSASMERLEDEGIQMMTLKMSKHLNQIYQYFSNPLINELLFDKIQQEIQMKTQEAVDNIKENINNIAIFSLGIAYSPYEIVKLYIIPTFYQQLKISASNQIPVFVQLNFQGYEYDQNQQEELQSVIIQGSLKQAKFSGSNSLQIQANLHSQNYDQLLQIQQTKAVQYKYNANIQEECQKNNQSQYQYKQYLQPLQSKIIFPQNVTSINFLQKVEITISQKTQNQINVFSNNLIKYNSSGSTPFNPLQILLTEGEYIISIKIMKHFSQLFEYFTSPSLSDLYLDKISQEIHISNDESMQYLNVNLNNIQNFSLDIPHYLQKNCQQYKTQVIDRKQSLQCCIKPEEDIVQKQYPLLVKKLESGFIQSNYIIPLQFSEQNIHQIKTNQQYTSISSPFQNNNVIKIRQNKISLKNYKKSCNMLIEYPNQQKTYWIQQLQQRKIKILQAQSKASQLRKISLAAKLSPQRQQKQNKLKEKISQQGIYKNSSLLMQKEEKEKNQLNQKDQQAVIFLIAQSIKDYNKKKLQDLGFSSKVITKYSNHDPHKYISQPIQRLLLPNNKRRYPQFNLIPYNIQPISRKQ